MKSKLISLFLLALGLGLHAQTFTLKSKELGGQFVNKQFANSFGCNGDNISPQLSWENAPKETVAFAITMYDPDAPTGSGFWHWVMFNIPANVNELKSNAGDENGKKMPKDAISVKNDGGKEGYMGPCPPAGPAHRYIITVYALNKKLDLDKNASCAVVGFNLHFATIAKASIMVYGGR